jgi:hypothetical protein
MLRLSFPVRTLFRMSPKQESKSEQTLEENSVQRDTEKRGFCFNVPC